MRFLFELSKFLFITVLLCIAILQYQGGALFDEQWVVYLTRLLFPAFFVLWGIVLCWLLILFFGESYEPDERLLTKWFFAGLVVGICFAFLYLARLSWTIA
jgi:hypothetical protein